MSELKERIITEVKKDGISKTHVEELLTEEEMSYFYDIQRYFEKKLESPQIAKRCEAINRGMPIMDRSKWYELTQFEYLNRALGLEDGNVMRLMVSDTLVSLARSFYGQTPKLRNVLTWVHPENPFTEEMASQRWHRDQEDFEIFKCFIYLSPVSESQGALQYIKETHHGARFQDVTDNMKGHGYGPFKYQPPQEQVVRATGDVGTIYFVNTNGIHKGGSVREGTRCLVQGVYLKQTAPLIQNGVLGTFNHNEKVNIVNYESDKFKSLTTKQQYLLT